MASLNVSSLLFLFLLGDGSRVRFLLVGQHRFLQQGTSKGIFTIIFKAISCILLLNWELPFRCLLLTYWLILVSPEVGNSLQLLTKERGRVECTSSWSLGGMKIKGLLLDEVSTSVSVTRRQEVIWKLRKANVESKHDPSSSWAMSCKALGYSSSWRGTSNHGYI